LYYWCEIINKTKGYPEDIPLNECSGKLKKSIFFSERSSENIRKVNTLNEVKE